MNKRILDGAGLWKSDKLARITPEWMRAEYANWIPLALANGVFEADTRRIWATVYSYNRPDISFDDAEQIRGEFCRVGLLFLWDDQESGKVWGYFTGIEKSGRLPSKSRLDKKHEPIGPTPPADALKSYVESTRSKPLESGMVSHWLANGCLGFGFGTGFGKGEAAPAAASLSEAQSASDPEIAPIRPAKARKSENHPSDAGLRLASLLRNRVLGNNPSAKITERTLTSWGFEVDRMIRRDGRTTEQIASLIEWSQRDSFWQTNILSIAKLRKQFDQLTLKQRSSPKGGSGNGKPTIGDAARVTIAGYKEALN